MKLLLDTHVYLWWLDDASALTRQARNLIMDAEVVFVSAATIWESTIKIGIGKLQGNPEELLRGIDESGFEPLAITPAHATALAHLANHHKDPFDRILLAQAISEPLYLLTADRILQSYSDLVITIA